MQDGARKRATFSSSAPINQDTASAKVNQQSQLSSKQQLRRIRGETSSNTTSCCPPSMLQLVQLFLGILLFFYLPLAYYFISWDNQSNLDGLAQIQSKPSSCWLVLDIVNDYGAVGDNATDNTHAFRRSFQTIAEHRMKFENSLECKHQAVGGEVIIPKGNTFQTLPFNLTSNSILSVHGNIFAIQDVHRWPAVNALPSYGRCPDMRGKYRRHPFVNAIGQDNITIRGSGIIDGGGWYWYPFFKDFKGQNYTGRPHLMELNNCTNVEITGVTLKDSAFWTLHPVYCKNVHIHHMKLQAPICRLYACPNTDGIDVDSSENVMVEFNHIDVGDDHVTILAGKLPNKPNWFRTPPTKNVTVQHNTLGTGMGMAIG